MSRPVEENPRDFMLRVRMTAAERAALVETAKKLGMRQSDVVRQGIEIMAKKAKEKE